jgi:hypothetical protein
MRRHYLAAMAAAVLLLPTAGFAQTPVEDGARAGGDVGGAVGAIVGGTVGAAVQLPAEVIGAVTGAPGRSVVVEERIVIGEPLPPRVVLVPVPQHRQYSYAIVNDRRVIVEPKTRRVIHIIQ